MVDAHTIEVVVYTIFHCLAAVAHDLGNTCWHGETDVVEMVGGTVGGDELDVLCHDFIQIGITGEDIDDRTVDTFKWLVDERDGNEAVGVVAYLVVDHLMPLESLGELNKF